MGVTKNHWAELEGGVRGNRNSFNLVINRLSESGREYPMYAVTHKAYHLQPSPRPHFHNQHDHQQYWILPLKTSSSSSSSLISITSSQAHIGFGIGSIGCRGRKVSWALWDSKAYAPS